MPKKRQDGFIFKKGGNWFLRYRDNVIEHGQIRRKLMFKKLAPICDRYRTEKDLQELRDNILAPINSGKSRPESTLTVAEFAEEHWLPWARENCKPSTVAGYETLWKTYLAPHLRHIALRDFRPADAYNLFKEIHRHHVIGRSTLLHCKHRLMGIFTLARNQGVLDSANPIQGVTVPKNATAPSKTHAATLQEVAAILNILEKACEQKACVAVGLMFFAGLRPGEARGVCWQDFDGKRLSIRQSVWHTHTTAPKTEESEGIVPVIEPLREMLEQVRTADGNPSIGPILRGPSGKPINLDNLSKRVMAPLLAEKGITWHGWYSLRRGAGTAVTKLAGDQGLASKGLLRHANLSTTTRHYVKDVPENTQKAMDLLAGLFTKSSPAAGTKPN